MTLALRIFHLPLVIKQFSAEMSGLRKENLVRQVLTNTGKFNERGFEIWKCSHCDVSIKRKPNSGWTNLYGHVTSRHASALEQVRRSAEVALANGQTLTTSSFVGIVSDEVVKIAKYLGWVLMDDHSFNFLDKAWTKQYNNHGPISLGTVMKYLVLLTDKLKKAVSKTLPRTFGLVIDGWTLDSEHYMAIFAAFMEKDNASFCLLSYGAGRH